MRNTAAFFFGLALSVSTATKTHAQSAPDFTLSAAMASGKLELTATPPSKHHFNIKAPMRLEDGKVKLKPSAASAEKVSFHLDNTKPRQLAVTLFLCDNANTYCERHLVSANWDGKALGGAMLTAPNNTPSEKTKDSQSTVIEDRFGFIVNNPKAALERAKRENKPLIIDFFGIWCPPCNLLDEEVYPTDQFKNAAKAFVKLRVDADLPISWELKSKYKVTGYPTLVMITAQGDELGRIIGYRPAKTLASELEKALKNQNKPSAERKIALTPEQELDAKIEAETSDDKKIQLLEKAVAEFTKSPGSLAKLMELADLYGAKKNAAKEKESLLKATILGPRLVQKPEALRDYDLAPSDVWVTVAEAHEKMGKKENEKAAYQRAIAYYRTQLAKLKDAESNRGYNLELAYCLWKSGDVAGAEKLYRGLEAKYPQEFTFYYSHARMNLALKRYAQAQELASKALEYSYGDNKIRSTDLLAQAFDAQGKHKEGLAVIRATLQSISIPSDKSIRTHRYIKKLKELEEKLALKA